MTQQHQQQIKKLEDNLKQHENAATKTYDKLRNMRKHSKLHVSDHALIRYMERVQDVDIEALKASIVTPQLIKLYTMLGDGQFPIGEDSTRVIIENGVIVTILK